MKIKIIGAGLAGLASGIKILEKNPNYDVEIINMGHHVGGRATSWRDDKGYNINHGFHAIFEKYEEMLSLLDRAGVDKKATLIPTKKGYFYEEDSGKVHQFGTPFNKANLMKGYRYNYNISDNIRFASFFIKNYNTIFKDKNIEQYDDICFTKWALENGLNPKLLEKRSFRFTQDALFNWPSEISTYICMQSFRLIGKGKIYHVNGNYGENIIQPIKNYFEKLGGKITLYNKLTSLEYQGDRITALNFANPDPSPHQFGKNPWGKKVPTVKGTENKKTDFDKVIVAIPIDSFKELNEGDIKFWKEFDGIKNLQTITTINWQIWLEKQAMPNLKTNINGLDEPMGTVMDYKNTVDEYKNNPKYGSVLEFVGQATTFEHLSDEEIKEIVSKNFLKIPGTKDIKSCGIIHEKFSRNYSNHERYPLTDPGTLQFRPKSKTSYTNLCLAGDWVRNKIDVPTMEGAINSGYEAAENLT